MVLVGDSVSRQHFLSLGCLLRRLVLPSAKAAARALWSAWGNGSTAWVVTSACLELQYNLSLCYRPSTVNVVAEDMSVPTPPTPLPAGRRDLVLWNAAGVHARSEAQPTQWLHLGLLSSRGARRNGTVDLVYRATSAQAFAGSPDGSWEHPERDGSAMSCADHTSTNFTWRQRIEKEVMGRANIPLLLGPYAVTTAPGSGALYRTSGVHGASASAGHSCPVVNQTTGATHCDCTHFCLPGVPDVWSDLLQSFVLDDGEYV